MGTDIIIPDPAKAASLKTITRADALYDADIHPLRIRELARMGLDLPGIAKACNVDPDILDTWLRKYPETANAYREGRLPVDVLVEDALLANALPGEQVTEKSMTEDGPLGVTTRTERIVKKTNGDVSAQIKWLANRKKDKWGNAPETQQNLQIVIQHDDQSF